MRTCLAVLLSTLVIMTNAQKDRFNPIVNAIAKEFGWLRPDKVASEN